MKFIHISDLHLGKKVKEYSMLEEQRNALEQVLQALEEYRADALLVAGDIYDKPVPPVEAVVLFDWFISAVSKMNIKCFIISGNHDSVQRIGFGAELMEKSGVYVSKTYDGNILPFTITDDYGEVNIYMLPFVKPVQVKRYFPDSNIETYNDALKAVVQNIKPDTSKRNIIMVHQFITGAKKGQSEEESLGGLENVDSSVFDDFDYVALGHIHKSQAMGRKQVRYSGSMVKYAFDEIGQNKSMTIVNMEHKPGDRHILKTEENKSDRTKGADTDWIDIQKRDIKPVHDMIMIKGKYRELMSRDFYKDMDREAYIYAILLDEGIVPDALSSLRVIYPNIMKIDYNNKITSENHQVTEEMSTDYNKKPVDYADELFLLQNNKVMSCEQKKLLEEVFENIWEENQ